MLNRIRCKYILNTIMKKMIKDKKCLELIRFNKQYQNLLDISLNDYKTFYNIKIELYLIPKEQLKDGKNIFISTYKKAYTHIFFDNNKDEVDQNYITKNDNINKITIKIEKKAKVLCAMFYYCYCIKEINFLEFWEGTIINAMSMFFGCINLTKINLSNFKADKLAVMDLMFSNCSSLKNLDISCLNITDNSSIIEMFENCSDQLIIKILKQNKNIKKEAFCYASFKKDQHELIEKFNEKFHRYIK